MVGDQSLDVRSRDRQAAHRGVRPHARCSLSVGVEQRTLAEDVARAELSRTLGGFHGRGFFLEHEEPEPGRPRSISA